MASGGDQDIDDTLTSPSAPNKGGAPVFPTELLGRYALLNEVGSGGGGRVYRAFDRELERQVAIKVLKGTAASRPEVLSTRLRREAQANALLLHPNVVSVFDVGDHQGEVFIAMEFVDGGSLADWLHVPHVRRDVLDTFLQAGRGLFAAHEKGIIHRDFKPSNVLIGRDGRVRVADFGLARGLGSSDDDVDVAGDPSPSGLVDRSLTKTGALVGTPAYMAPEQFQGRMVDARADQFSFCLVLAEALTGQRAPRGELTANGWQTTDLEPAEWLRGKKLNARLRTMLETGLSLDPQDRFPSMQPVLEVLREELDQGRQWGTRLAVGALGVAALAVVLAALTPRERPCEGLDRPLRIVWNDTRKANLRLPNETQDGRREVAAALDRYAGAWTEARAEVCQATHVRGEQSEELLDVRMGCLNRHLEGLRLVLALIDDRRIADVGAALDAVLYLGTPGACAMAQSHGRASPPVGAARKTVEAAEALIAQARASRIAGLTRRGLTQAERAVHRAVDSGHKPTQAEAYELLGRLLEENDRYAEAMTAFDQAVVLSDATANDARRFEALVALIRLDEGTEERAGLTDRWVAGAEALLERQDGSALQRSTLSAARSRLSFRRGDLVACRRHGEQARLWLDQVPEGPLAYHLQVSEELSRCLERLGLRREAAGVVEETLARAEGVLGPTHPRIGQLSVQLSRALDFSGDRVGAKAAAERAVKISMTTLGDQHSQTAEAYQALANVMYREGDLAGSRRYLERALEVMKKVYGANSHQVGGLYSSLGLTVSQLGAHDEAHRFHASAVRILSASVGPKHPITAASIGRLGANLKERNDCSGAIKQCRTAMELLELSDPEHARILDQIRCMAGCMVELGRYREAVPALERGLALSERRDEPAMYRAWLEFLAAQALWETKEKARAISLARAAKARVQPTGLHQAFEAKVDDWLATRR